MRFAPVAAVAASLIALPLASASAQAAVTTPVSLTPQTPLRLVNARAEWTTYRGREALHLLPLAGQERASDQEMWAELVGSDFGDGTIEVDVAGARRAGYATDDASAFKGFVGLSFRVRGDTAERFYLRTENARLEDQLFRNRSTQYEAPPDATWQQLRRDSPGLYESYVDLEPGAWTHLRIEVSGRTARLYVHGDSQPALVVTDLKHGVGRGRLALWTRISADAHFANLRVSARSVDAPRSHAQWRDDALPRIAEVRNGRAERTTHLGRPAWRLVADEARARTEEAVFGVLDGPLFTDGVIELHVAGIPRRDAPPDSRGFVGLSFRTGPDAEWSEVFYLRPLNARVDDQLRRNHTVQYASDPAYPWSRLREESPGRYESYADMEPGGWTALRVEVSGTTARLYVNGAAQPALIVKDLKHGTQGGAIALWAHVQTDGYFGPVTVTRR